MQNATARITDYGRPFSSIIEALEWAIKTHSVSVYYSDDSVERLQWLSDRIKDFKAEKRVIRKTIMTTRAELVGQMHFSGSADNVKPWQIIVNSTYH